MGTKTAQYILPWKTFSNYFCKKKEKKRKLPGCKFHLVLRKISPEAIQPSFSPFLLACTPTRRSHPTGKPPVNAREVGYLLWGFQVSIQSRAHTDHSCQPAIHHLLKGPQSWHKLHKWKAWAWEPGSRFWLRLAIIPNVTLACHFTSQLSHFSSKNLKVWTKVPSGPKILYRVASLEEAD